MMKKIAAIALALVLALGMTTVAFATESTDDQTVVASDEETMEPDTASGIEEPDPAEGLEPVSDEAPAPEDGAGGDNGDGTNPDTGSTSFVSIALVAGLLALAVVGAVTLKK